MSSGTCLLVVVTEGEEVRVAPSRHVCWLRGVRLQWCQVHVCSL